LVDRVFDQKRPVAAVSKDDESEFFSDTEVTTPKLPLIAKSAAKLTQIARSSVAANAESFVEQQPEHIDLEECLNFVYSILIFFKKVRSRQSLKVKS